MLSPHYTTPPPQNATPVPTPVPRPSSPRGIPKGGRGPLLVVLRWVWEGNRNPSQNFSSGVWGCILSIRKEYTPTGGGPRPRAPPPASRAEHPPPPPGGGQGRHPHCVTRNVTVSLHFPPGSCNLFSPLLSCELNVRGKPRGPGYRSRYGSGMPRYVRRNNSAPPPSPPARKCRPLTGR